MLALGVDHRSAPTAVREALAFEGERLRRGLDALKDGAPGAEFVLLSTCNRVELYAATETDPLDGDALAGFLARFHDVPVAMLDRHLVARRDEAAVAHLFRVAAGLESLVVGEGQVLGQVRDAYRLASDCKAVGPILHHVFQRALRVGKRVREETGLDRGRSAGARPPPRLPAGLAGRQAGPRGDGPGPRQELGRQRRRRRRPRRLRPLRG